MNVHKQALICNIIILILEVLGFSLYVHTNHSLDMEYYTIDSNLLTLFSSMLFIFFYKNDKKIVRDLRFVSTSCLTITILVVAFILTPMANFDYKTLMLENEFFIFHLLCPIISVISYVLYEKRSEKEYLGLLFTLIYSVVLVFLNLTNIVIGPYPFLKVKEQSIQMCFIWSFLIIGGSYLIGKLLNYLNKKKRHEAP